MRKKYKHIHIALPLMDEMDALPDFMKALYNQEFKDFRLYACVNQPDSWWDSASDKHKCINNQETLDYLSSIDDLDVRVIDRSSRGHGWKGKDHGVGWARKTVMDAIDGQADPYDLIVSLDGDTQFDPAYFSSILDNFNQNPGAVAMAVPYYHKLVDDDRANKAILRYEIYMRNYNINLWRIDSPYAFTALGSAMALPVWSYRAINGITPKKSGEDFYFLQKLRKYGKLLVWNKEKVYPGTRFSDRVFFGTGPAMIKGSKGDWTSYPIYHHSLFEEIKAAYGLFDKLYDDIDLETPLDGFLKEIFREGNIWKPIRENCRDRKQFVMACHHKLDGLRILQYLKTHQAALNKPDGQCLAENFENLNTSINFEDIGQLNIIRNRLVEMEEGFQKAALIH